MQVSSLPVLAAISLTLGACGPARIADDGDTGDPETSQTASDTPAETSGETGEMDDGSGFFVDPDEGHLTECDPFQQDCPEGEKCAPYASSGGNWDANKCVPIMGDQVPGEPCIYGGAAEGTDDCDATSMCWDVEEVDGELVGTCVAFCEGSPDAPVCPAGYYCPIASDGTINVCIATCDPVAQDCDHPGIACYSNGGEFLCVPTTQDIPAGQPCGFINDCAPGHMCATTEVLPDCEGSACCTPYCDISLGAAPCAGLPGTACVSFWEAGMAPPEYQHVGICILP